MQITMKNEGRPRGGQRGPQKTTEQRIALGLQVQQGFSMGKSYTQLGTELGESYQMMRGCFDQVVAEQATALAAENATKAAQNKNTKTVSTTLGVNGTTSADPVPLDNRIEIPDITPYIRLSTPISTLMPELKVVQEKSRRDQLIDAAIAFPDKAELYYDMIKMLDKR